MLTRLRAENFLSLRRVEVELGRINVLVGRNASGKSNLVKLLRFLHLLARGRGLREAAAELGYGGPRDLAYGRDPRVAVSVRLEVELGGCGCTYSLQLDTSREAVEVEELVCGGDRLLARREPDRASLLLRSGPLVELVVTRDALALPEAARRREADERVRDFHSYLTKWAFYNFNPAAIRGRSPVGHSRELAYDGGNLPQVLLTLLTTERRVFTRVEELLRAAVPEVEELLTPVSDGWVRIAVRETGFEEPFEPGHVSDGTLRILAFATALALPSTLVCFEEPENCVHPSLLQMLVELIRLSGKQVILTTHSPHLLDHVRPEEVLLVAKQRGETRVVRLASVEDVDAVRRYLELGGTLGEAWVAGLLGSEY